MHWSKPCAIVIDCDDIDKGLAFWRGALDIKEWEQDGEYIELKSPLIKPGILLQAVPEPKRSKSRMHLDICTDDLEAEVQRLEALGARRREHREHWWVMEDPNGNEFCVVAAEAIRDDDEALVWET
jgi:predicted enzyme related to lactoylglutathione lyase